MKRDFAQAVGNEKYPFGNTFSAATVFSSHFSSQIFADPPKGWPGDVIIQWIRVTEVGLQPRKSEQGLTRQKEDSKIALKLEKNINTNLDKINLLYSFCPGNYYLKCKIREPFHKNRCKPLLPQIPIQSVFMEQCNFLEELQFLTKKARRGDFNITIKCF